MRGRAGFFSALGIALMIMLMAAAGGQAAITFDRSWGLDVDSANPSTGPEVCTVAADCRYGSPGSVGGAVFPQSLGTDAAGNVYVTEFAGSRVQKFDPDGNFLMAFGKNVNSVGPGTGPEVCTISADCTLGTSGTAGGEFTNPTGVAVGPAGTIWVSDTNNNRIQEFSAAGTFLRAIGRDVSISTPGTDLEVCTVESDCKAGFVSAPGIGGMLSAPNGIAVDATGKVFVANLGGRRVEVFEADGAFSRAWGSGVVSGVAGLEVCTVASQCRSGTTVTGVAGEMTPAGLALGPTGHVYIFDAVHYRVEEFTSTGGFVRLWGKDVDSATAGTGFEICETAADCKNGEKGNKGGEFLNESAGPNAPAANTVAVGADGTVYVTDRPDSRVQAFASTGDFLAVFGVDVDTSVGTVNDFEVCTVAANCTGGSAPGIGGAMTTPTGIAAGPGGAVYQGDQTGQRIQKFFDQDCAASFAFSAASYAAQESAGSVAATIERSGDTGCAASVSYATSDGSANAGSDYSATSGTAVFAPGETMSQVAIPLLDDDLPEANETLAVTLSNPNTGATLGAPAAATLTITNDDPVDTIITTTSTATNSGVASYSFAANPPAGATFECSYDNAPFTSCTSPAQSGPLSPGTHNFRVRASNGDGTDPTPASRNFIVDRVPPSVTINLSGTRTPSGDYVSAAAVDATATDPPLSSGVRNKFCLIDPASPPTSFGSFGSQPCGSVVSTPGTHTVYAIANDEASNESAIVSTAFRIAPTPETVITSGPSGVSYSLPKFTFSSDIPGSSFECRIDDGPFSRCGSPLTPTGLSLGDHLIHVRAISPEGVTDLTPATRSFTLGVKTLNRSCSRLVSFGGGRGKGSGAEGCTLFENEKCPVGSVCTSKFVADGDERDFRFTHQVNAQMVTVGEIIGTSGIRCWVDEIPPGFGTSPCPTSGSQSVLGTGQALRAFCEKIDSVPTGYDYVPGPDRDRSIRCKVTFTIKPAGSLTTIGAEDTVSIFAPGSGILGISSGGTTGRRASTAARRPKAFKRARRNVTKAGPVTFKLKLARWAKAKLKKKGKVRLPVRISFTPSDGGKTISKKVNVKLTRTAQRPNQKPG